jgi:hypothetical protein
MAAQEERTMNHIAFAAAFAASVVLGSVTPGAIAQSSQPQARAQKVTIAQADASCEKTVRDYVNALRYIKQATGSSIGGHVEQAYIGEAEITQIAQQQGYCGAAQVLKSKGVTR